MQDAILSAVLDQHRDELTRLSGVIGTGVGLPEAGSGDSAAVIQIFVSQAAPREIIEQQATRILGREYPVEVIQMSVPQAEGVERERNT
jgi:hypothetical protein